MPPAGIGRPDAGDKRRASRWGAGRRQPNVPYAQTTAFQPPAARTASLAPSSDVVPGMSAMMPGFTPVRLHRPAAERCQIQAH
jgi:hypothetical protein